MAVLGRSQPIRPHLPPPLVAAGAVTGTSAVTLDNLTGAASGTETITGTVAQTLENFTANGVGAGIVSGTVAVTLANLIGAATGTETITGTVARTLSSLTSTATGTETITGTSATTLQNFVAHGSNIAGLFVTTASANGHYLKDQNGDPYFVQGNSPQNMVPNGTLADMEDFFADQQTRGFNSSQVHLVYNMDADAETATAPFGNPGHFGSPNAAYWETIDSMFDLAETYGFTLWATVLDNISSGHIAAAATDGECFAYGQFLGARYKDVVNLVWVIGNDLDSSQWTARNPKYLQMIDGIRDQGDTHLACVWNNQDPGNANTDWDTDSEIDTGYAYSQPPYVQSGTSYQLTRTGYPKPFVWFEGTYYAEKNASTTPPLSTDLELRKLAWWCITWGSVGHFFGTHEGWAFGDWQSELTATIYDHLALIPGAFAGLDDWELLVPDFSHVFQTGGRGTTGGTLDSDTFSTAAFVNGGQLGVAYFPSSRGSITFDTTKLTGPVTAHWYDVTSGDTATESTPAAPTHPGTNDGGDADWFLIFQGTDPITGTSAVTLANLSSAASGTETITGTVAKTLADFTSAASGTETITGSSAVTLADFTSTAAGLADIVGTSATTLAAFTSTANAIESFVGTSATTLQNFVSGAAGLADIVGTVALTLANFTDAASGSVTNPGSNGASVLDNFVGIATGSVVFTGTSAVTLADFTSAASGTETITGSSAVTLADFTASATGPGVTITGTIAATLAPAIGAAVGTETISGSVAVTLAAFVAAATGSSALPGGSAAITLANFIAAATGVVTNPPGGLGDRLPFDDNVIVVIGGSFDTSAIVGSIHLGSTVTGDDDTVLIIDRQAQRHTTFDEWTVIMP